MYFLKDIEIDMREYFGEGNEDIIRKIMQTIGDILNEKDIEVTCKKVRETLVNIKQGGKEVFPDKKNLPKWIRKVVFMVIYQCLLDCNPRYNQSKILVEMGLYPDIFGKKHWNMYSPDMKIRQDVYQNLELPFNHAEIESNNIFRAMIHYMISSSEVLTDTFIDMFGKLGVVPALCATGYKHAKSWVGKGDYNVLTIFSIALRKKVKVCKSVKYIQYKIEHAYNREQMVMRYLGMAATCSGEIKRHTNVMDIIQGTYALPIDIYTYAACFIVQQYFAPEYWLDNNLRIVRIKDKDTKEQKSVISAELVYNLSKQKIEKFYNTNFSEEIVELANAYSNKRFSFEEIDIKKKIRDSKYINDDIYEDNDQTDFLYIDPPKYLREERRFQFGLKYYLALIKILFGYHGDWILTWKNYVEILKDSREDNIYSGLYTGNRIEPMEEFFCEKSEKVSLNRIKEIYDAILYLDKERELYVFRYRDKNRNRNHPNSIIFITPIDFTEPNDHIFCQKYGLIFKYKGKLEKLSYKQFYNTTMKFMDEKTRSTTRKKK